MRFAPLAARALMGGLIMETLPEHKLNSTHNPARLLIRQGFCDIGEEECSDGCMPAGSACCASLGRDTYCDAGYYCMTDRGCCRNGRTCSGASAGCGAGKEECNNACMPAGSVCCPDGGYCDAGYTCGSDGYCHRGTGSGNDDDEPSCDTGKTLCDDEWCIPTGGVCCNMGLGLYCEAGYYCLPDGCCRNGRTCTSSSDDDDSDDDTTTTTSSSSTSRPFPTSTPDDDSDDDSFGPSEDDDNTTTTTEPTPTTPVDNPGVTFGVTNTPPPAFGTSGAGRKGIAGWAVVGLAAGMALFV
ncbi:hypothetical protein VTJ49DRAFT_2069 [Mycothermus thermophilus]|uniref:GPI anchored protein n=1 Tax=Humicola insolens TaxID=85995 RepID=A0ABR3VAQ1_HUMIN